VVYDVLKVAFGGTLVAIRMMALVGRLVDASREGARGRESLATALRHSVRNDLMELRNEIATLDVAILGVLERASGELGPPNGARVVFGGKLHEVRKPDA
jgi:hypothetical protein